MEPTNITLKNVTDCRCRDTGIAGDGITTFGEKISLLKTSFQPKITTHYTKQTRLTLHKIIMNHKHSLFNLTNY